MWAGGETWESIAGRESDLDKAQRSEGQHGQRTLQPILAWAKSMNSGWFFPGRPWWPPLPMLINKADSAHRYLGTSKRYIDWLRVTRWSEWETEWQVYFCSKENVKILWCHMLELNILRVNWLSHDLSLENSTVKTLYESEYSNWTGNPPKVSLRGVVF